MADLDRRRRVSNLVAHQTRALLRAQRTDHGRALCRARRRVPRREAAALVRRPLCDAWNQSHVRLEPGRRAVRTVVRQPNATRRQAGQGCLHLQLLRRAAPDCTGEEMMRGVLMRVSGLCLAGLLVSPTAMAQNADPGRQTFVTSCAGCHGTDGNGGELGPNIAVRVPARTDQELAGVVRDGRPLARMPAFPQLTDGRGTQLNRLPPTPPPPGATPPKPATPTPPL